MSEEEKDLDLQESEDLDDLDLGDLADFVDLADLGDLEGADNADIFGDLGDVGDLGELADFSASVPDFEPAAEEMPDLDTVDLDVPAEEEIDIPEYIDLSDSEETASSDVIPDLQEIPDVAEEADDGDAIPTLDVPILTPEEIEEQLSAAGGDDALAMEEPAVIEEPAADDFPVLDDSMMSVEPEIPVTDIGSESADTGMEDFSVTEDGLLGDLDINFDDFPADPGMDATLDMGSALEPEPADVPEPAVPEEPAAAGGSGIDSMLGGLLNNLDMGATMDSTESDAGSATGGDADEVADLLGLDDAGLNDQIGAMDDDASLEDMLDVSMIPDEGAETEKKPGFFKRVFGNVITDEIAEEERAAAEKEAEEAVQAEEEAKKAAEEKAAAKEQKKAEKAAKAEAKKKAKAEEKARKAEEKEARKAAEEEAAAEIEVVGKLNKVGVSIIAIATVLFLVFEISGTNIFSYVRTKKEATNYFKMGKYTEAYQTAVGTDMKNKDKEEYDKIKTVMRVQQAINAYQNYSRVKYYPEALDALLRGLKRYDANIEHAVALEVDQDMLSCRKQILSILQTEFQMTEADAYAIISLDKPQYQSKVIDLGIKKATN